MTDAERNLPRKPLVEAILEIKWDLDGKGDPAHPLFAGAMAGIVADRYPSQERLPAADVPDEFVPHVVKFRMRPRGVAYPLIQAGPGIVTLNSVDDYSWDSYKTNSLHLWDSLQRAYPPFNGGVPPHINNVLLKYINSHPLESLNPRLFAQQRLHTEFALPPGITEHETAGPPANIALLVNFPLRRADTTATVRIQNGTSKRAPAMIWELTAEGKFSIPVDRETFSEWLDYSHGVIDHWFFSLIEGTLLSEFSEEVSESERG